MQPPDELRRLDVGRVLIPEPAALHAEDEAERLHAGGEIGQRKVRAFPRVEIVKLEGLEIADQDVARALVLGQGIEIVPGLPVGASRDRAPRSSVRR